MSSIISIHCLLQFVVFIYILPIYRTIQPKLEFVFLNGYNVIRCSDEQVQVYKSDGKFLSQILHCDNKDDIYTGYNAGFKWDTLRLICSDDNSMVYEEQDVKVHHDGGDGFSQLPAAEGQRSPSEDRNALTVEHDDTKKVDKIITVAQSADDEYFNQGVKMKERRIYIWFPDHGILCRVMYTSDHTNPCPSMHGEKVADVNHACYYNPGADHEPTVTEMEAEFAQIEQAQKPANSDIFVLDLKKPDVDADTIDADESQSNDSLPAARPSSNPQKPKPAHLALVDSPKSKKKKSLAKITGTIVVILLLIAVIGGVGFYLFRQYRLNKSVSGSASVIEHGNNKGLSSLTANESQQSLSVASIDDGNTEISINGPSKNGKPTVELQASTENRRARAAANATFNEDM